MNQPTSSPLRPCPAGQRTLPSARRLRCAGLFAAALLAGGAAHVPAQQPAAAQSPDLANGVRREARAFVYTTGLNTFGELGYSTAPSNQSHSFQRVVGLPGPVSAASGGAFHNMAIFNGAVYTWGSNYDGELADGTHNNRLTPALVPGLPAGVTAVAAAYNFSFALVNGAVYSWGRNDESQLGLTGQTLSDHLVPSRIVELSDGVTAIAAGAVDAAAIRDGALYMWGYNRGGELGDGTFNARATPRVVDGFSSGVTAVAIGANTTLAVKGGALYAWGVNADGEVGIGMASPAQVTRPVATSLTSGVTAVAAGAYHSLAVVDGYVYAWGDNFFSEVGDGTSTDRPSPTLIDPAHLHNIVAVAASFSTSYALSADGTLWVWGDNRFGQFGLPDQPASLFPTPQHVLPPPGFRFTSVSSHPAGYHVLTTAAARLGATIGIGAESL